MTEIGKMIMEQGVKKGKEEGLKEGLKEGKEEGLKEGKAETLIKLFTKKFGKVPDTYKENIKKLSIETLDIISLEIFDIKDIKEIEKYF
ncbi:DUF4351 domain-containing protein [Haloimpatiens sp. FM7315]|uniref:DUF4351 domain-containing protein n=1 Tax=Haloimpatiens sp. FM7315 TaxID=3298609 RepID=UPI0035A351A4